MDAIGMFPVELTPTSELAPHALAPRLATVIATCAKKQKTDCVNLSKRHNAASSTCLSVSVPILLES